MPDVRTSKPKLQFGRLGLAQSHRRELFADIPAGSTLETILEPSYWAHHAHEIKPLDIIEAFCEDGSWEARLRVMFVANGEVKLSLMSKVDHAATAVAAPADTPYEIKWISPTKKYAVRRKDNHTVIADGLYPESAAHEYLRGHLRNMKE